MSIAVMDVLALMLAVASIVAVFATAYLLSTTVGILRAPTKEADRVLAHRRLAAPTLTFALEQYIDNLKERHAPPYVFLMHPYFAKSSAFREIALSSIARGQWQQAGHLLEALTQEFMRESNSRTLISNLESPIHELTALRTVPRMFSFVGVGGGPPEPWPIQPFGRQTSRTQGSDATGSVTFGRGQRDAIPHVGNPV